jgi:hypothetical protein
LKIVSCVDSSLRYEEFLKVTGIGASTLSAIIP